MNSVRWIAPVLVGLALLAAPPLAGQYIRTRSFSRPSTPSAAELRRLGLHLRWRISVPMDGTRDGLMRVLVDRKDILVLTRSGMVARYDAESGKMYWKARYGRPYAAVPALAANARSVFLVVNAEVFSLDRKRGEREWRMKLLSGLTTAPATGELEVESKGGTRVEDLLIVPGADSRLTAFLLPPPEEELAGYTVADRRELRKPRELWTVNTNLDLAFQPIHTPASIFAIGPSGKGRGYITANGGDSFSFEAEGKIRSRPGQFGSMAYIGSNDGNVYAVDMFAGKQVWRHTAGSGVTQSPAALDTDVFVTSEYEGMARLDSLTGESQWKVPLVKRVSSTNPEASLFLAASPRFVYAKDRSGRFLVIDRKRGVTLTRAAWTDFKVPVTNVITDRVYLAAHDGTILCLHDRAQASPVRYQKELEDAAEPIHRRLNEGITIEKGRNGPFKELLDDLALKFNFKVVYDTEALKKAMLEKALDKVIPQPPVTEKPLIDVIKAMLLQVKLGYRISAGKLVITPPAGGDKPPPKPMPKPKPKPKPMDD